MSQASRDANQVTATLGSYNGAPMPLKAEHATGYLKIAVSPRSLAASSVSVTVAKKDGNNVSTMLGTYNGSPKAFLIDHTTGYLRATIV